jgi:magnesium transporter
MLINCVAYRAGQKIADITVDQISDYVQQADCFVWVALKDSTPAELAEMQQEFGLHPLAVEDARHGHQRPKLEEYGSMLFCVLHVLHMDSSGELEAGEVAVFVGSNYILSVRNRSSIDFLHVRARSEREPELLRHGAGFVLYALLDAVVDRYFDVVHRLEGKLEAIEERLFAKERNGKSNIAELYDLKRQLVTVQHAAVPLLEVVAHMTGGRVPTVCQSMQEYFRDVYDHLERIVRAVETLREMLTTAIQVNIALISLEESAVSKRLASYAALVAIPTMIAGVYGMNFQYMPELASPLGYPLTLFAMVVLDALAWWRLRRAGWL